MKKKTGAPNIVLDLSIKNALESRANVSPSREVLFPWWFKRSTMPEYGEGAMQAYAYVMEWLQYNAPEEAENIFDESDLTQNIIINPGVLIQGEILEAFIDAGFRVMEEDDIPGQEKSDIGERLKHGSNFNDKWH